MQQPLGLFLPPLPSFHMNAQLPTAPDDWGSGHTPWVPNQGCTNSRSAWQVCAAALHLWGSDLSTGGNLALLETAMV